MATSEEFYAALAREDRRESLRRAAEHELAGGTPRGEVVAQLEELRSDLRTEGREDDEDVVLEILDFVTGWCSPHVLVGELQPPSEVGAISNPVHALVAAS
jgi:hypothetical protein